MLHLYIVALAIGILLSYLCGSVPSAIIVGKKFYGIDVREHGSGNTGSTNVVRVLGWKPGLIVFILDVFKSIIAVLITIGVAYLLESGFLDPAWAGKTLLTSGPTFEVLQIVAALAAIIGHMFSPFLAFKGGKGVATALGGMLAVLPLPGLCALGVFLIAVLSTRYVSLGSICAAISLPFFIVIFKSGSPVYLIFGLCVSVALLFAHRSNMVRLYHHEESKFSVGGKKKSKDAQTGDVQEGVSEELDTDTGKQDKTEQLG